MTQPTDRLGQPLSVGDWVVYHCHKGRHKDDGKSYQVMTLWESPVHGPSAELCDGENARLGELTKINPKPEAGSWEELQGIWRPDGVIS